MVAQTMKAAAATVGLLLVATAVVLVAPRTEVLKTSWQQLASSANLFIDSHDNFETASATHTDDWSPMHEIGSDFKASDHSVMEQLASVQDAQLMSLAEKAAKKNSGGTNNGQRVYDHGIDPQDFPQHEGLSRAGESVMGNAVSDESTWGAEGRGTDMKAKDAKLMKLAATAAKAAKNSGGTNNGQRVYDHSIDPQDFPQHEGLSRAGESVVGNAVADQSTWGTQGRGIDMKAKDAKLMKLAITAARKSELAATAAKAKNSGGTNNGERVYDHSLDPQDFPQHEGLARAGESVVGNAVADQSTWGTQGRGIDMKAAKLSQLASTKAKNSGGTHNGEQAYDHNLDPQDFPQHEGLARAGESVVGNGYAADSTYGAEGRGIDMKSNHATLSQLAKAAKPAAKKSAAKKSVLPKSGEESPLVKSLKKRIAVNKASQDTRYEDPLYSLPHHSVLFGKLQENKVINPGFPAHPHKGPLLEKHYAFFNSGGVASSTRSTSVMGPPASMHEIKTLIANNDPAVAKRIDEHRLAYAQAFAEGK
jgi:hypothetical protein